MKMPRFFKVFWLPFDAWGACIPPFGILIQKDFWNDTSIRAHELGHWEQYTEWGLWKYYCTIFVQYVKWGRFNAPVEADAKMRGMKYLDKARSTQ